MTSIDTSRWADSSYWTELCPWLSITDLPFQAVARVSSPANVVPERDRQLEEGHLRFDNLFTDTAVEPLRRAVERLIDAGVPTAFLYVFDEVWQLYASACDAISVLVGEDFLLGGDLWAWHLPPGPSSVGWGPHRDDQFADEGFNADGLPTHVSLWVALSDADEKNGCMYVLPKHLTDWTAGRTENLSIGELASVRAQPAEAGTLLSWTSDVLHWGSRSTSEATNARTSMCLYAQRADHRRLATDMIGLTEPVPLVHRIGMISRALIRYRKSTLHPDIYAGDEILIFAEEHERRFQVWLSTMAAINAQKSSL